MNGQKLNSRFIIAAIVIVVLLAGGAFAYRSYNINQKRAEAVAELDAFDSSKYDGEELDTIKSYMADARARLEASGSPEEFDEIVTEFEENTKDVKTTAQKEEEERKAREEAERIAREEAARQAAAAAAVSGSSSSSGGSGSDSGGCVGGSSSNFY